MRDFPIKFSPEEIKNRPPYLFLLSNQNLKLFTNTYGGSYIKFNQISITSKISSKDNGIFFYIKDKKSGEVWSATPWPTLKFPDNFEITFDNKVLEFHSTNFNIESVLKITIDQSKNILVYELSLINLSNENRDLEIINYSNIVLIDDFRKNQDHRAFHNLSVQSRFDQSLQGLFFKKRAFNTSVNYPEVFFKFFSENPQFNFESNRDKFIGRTKDLVNPDALEHELSNTQGNVLDPIAAFKTIISLSPNSAKSFYLTIICEQFEENISNLVKENFASFSQVSSYFQNLQNQVVPLLKELMIDDRKALLYQRMGSYMITGNEHTDTIKRNLPTNFGAVDSLWKNRISGDFPVLLIVIDNIFFNELVIDAINFHKYLVRSGYDLDIVFLIETDPNENVVETLQQQISSLGYENKIDKNIGVYILENYLMEEVDIIYLKHFARLIVNSSNFNKVLENE